eukprot:4820604-Prymnesium_polylepis.1
MPTSSNQLQPAGGSPRGLRLPFQRSAQRAELWIFGGAWPNTFRQPPQSMSHSQPRGGRPRGFG